MLRCMRWLGKSWALVLVAAVCALAVCWPDVALGQDVPPAPSLRRSPPVWLGYFVIAVMLAIVIAVSLMPSKRTHLEK